jgi:nucleoside-diphosphate-sugar epimerase
MRVLVTGAQGCIGAWVVRALLSRGIDVLMFDIDPEPRRLSLIIDPRAAARVPVETGRIEDSAHVKKIVREGEITHIVHLAAVLMPFCQANPATGAMINVIGTLNVFEAARDAGRSVRVVYASSSAVWGPEEAYSSGKLNEENPLKPSTHYGVFKQSNEGNARVFFETNGISSVGLRPWTVYGVGRDSGLTADPTFALRALARGEPYQIRLSGFMDLQYVEDVAEAFVRSLGASLEGAHVFNLEGAATHMDEFIKLLEAIRPGAASLITARGPQVPVAWRMDGSLLRTRIGDLPATPLEAGARRTLEMFVNLAHEGRL